jgi:hypothetical protein
MPTSAWTSGTAQTPSSGTVTACSAPISSTSRGDEAMGSTWSYLDITALGRQEEWEDSPEGYPQTPPYEWWIWHDDRASQVTSRWAAIGLVAGHNPRQSWGHVHITVDNLSRFDSGDLRALAPLACRGWATRRGLRGCRQS